MSESQARRLTLLSQSINDAIKEIFSMAFAQADSEHPLTLPSGDRVPEIRLVDSILWINRLMIPLASRQKTLLLVQAFFRSKTLTLSKAEIASAVYGHRDSYSPRYMDSQEINLTKLLSRTRTFFEESLEHAYTTQPLDWLVFDIKTRRYALYRPRPDHLKMH